MLRTSTFSCLAISLIALSSTGLAQWSIDPAVNLALQAAPSDQNQVKIVSTSDGGFWVSWLDGIGSGWDVRLLRIDPAGNPWSVGPLLVVDRSFSSTQDYGLAVDSADNALLAYRDDSSGSTEVGAAKVSPLGTLLWTQAGVALTSGAGFVASPDITATSDGGAVVAWTENSSTKAQKLDAAGVAQWVNPVDLTPGAGAYFLSAVQPSGTGAILSIVHQTGGFTSPKHLVAQNLDANGAPTWGATPLPIFDGGSLQIGNFPDFVSDGAGGALFYWYSSSPSLQCFVQRVNAAGVERWAHNGVAVANTAGQLRVNPHAQYDAVSDDVYVAWNELNGSQSQFGIHAQRIDQAGTLQWGPSGSVLAALSPLEKRMPRVAPDASTGRALVMWEEIPGFNADQLFGARLNAAGVIDVSTFDIASTPSGKSRLDTAISNAGFVALVWSDARNDSGDIYGQAVRFEGNLAGESILGVPYCGAQANSTGSPGALEIQGSNLISINQIGFFVEDLPTGQFGFFLCSQTTGLTMNPGGSQGNLCLGGAIGRYNQAGQIILTTAAGTADFLPTLSQTPTPFGPTAITTGQTWNFQCWYRDNMPGVSQSNFTNAVSLTFQ